MELKGYLSRVYEGTEWSGSVTEQSKGIRGEKSRGKRQLAKKKIPKDKELEIRTATSEAPERQGWLPHWDITMWLALVR